MNFNSNLIDFFKRHNLYNEDMFNYFSMNTTMIDYQDPDQRIFIGTFYILDKNSKLIKIHLNIPYVYDDKTMLISIHEIVHAILLYKKIKKKVDLGLDKEALSMLYEKIYVNEINTPEIIKYSKKLDSCIEEKHEEYVFGLNVREELLKNYNYDINSMDKIAKRLARRYKKN